MFNLTHFVSETFANDFLLAMGLFVVLPLLSIVAICTWTPWAKKKGQWTE